MTKREVWVELVRIAMSSGKYNMSESVNLATEHVKKSPNEPDTDGDGKQ